MNDNEQQAKEILSEINTLLTRLDRVLHVEYDLHFVDRKYAPTSLPPNEDGVVYALHVEPRSSLQAVKTIKEIL